MGIQGLHQVIKPALKEVSLNSYKGQKAAIDIMVWLYKGSYSCAYELGRGDPTLNFLQFPVKMLQLLKQRGIKPICVFDGFHLQAKRETEKDRFDSKLKNRMAAQEADKNGDSETARKFYSRCLVLRQRMVDLFMDVLKELEIEFVVAPYEADAQMAYMVKQEIADFAISEDSDLIAYGCPKMLMKLDFYGKAQAWCAEDFKSYKVDLEKDKSLKSLAQLQALSPEEFRYACCMAGCEYLPNIDRIGLKVALKHFEKQKSFEDVMKFLRSNKATKEKVPEDYEEKARQVVELFCYQTVLDTRTLELTQLSSIYDTAELNMAYCGPHEALLDNLQEFSQGEIYRSTGQPRKSYMGQSVVDMSLIRMHFARGEISDRSFVCLDYTFFKEDETKQHYNPHNNANAMEEEVKGSGGAAHKVAAQEGDQQKTQTEQAVDYARLGQSLMSRIGAELNKPCQESAENLQRLIANKEKGRAQVEDDAFGFFTSDDDDDENGNDAEMVNEGAAQETPKETMPKEQEVSEPVADAVAVDLEAVPEDDVKAEDDSNDPFTQLIDAMQAEVERNEESPLRPNNFSQEEEEEKKDVQQVDKLAKTTAQHRRYETRSSQKATVKTVSSGKLTPKENIFRKPLRSSAAAQQRPSSTNNPEQIATSPFKAFDVVVDPGSEQDLKTKAQLEEKENQRKQSSLISAYVKPATKAATGKTPVSKKRQVSQMTSAGTPSAAKSAAPKKHIKGEAAQAASGKTRKLSDFFSKKA